MLAFAICSLALSRQGTDAVATVNGEVITSQYYYRRMEYLPGLGRTSITGQFVEVMPAIATLDALVTESIILQLAKEKKLTPTEAEIDHEVQYRTRNNPNFVTEWMATGRTMPELRHQLMVDRAQFKLQTDGVVITDTQIQNNYEAAKSTRFTVPQRVKLRVITVRDDDSKAKVDADLKAGKSFASVASQYSTDSSKTQGGDFGVVPIDLLGEQVKTAIGNLKKGQMTDWMKSDNVFAKFLLEDSLPQSIVPLDDSVREDLRREMMLRAGLKNDLPKMIKQARQNANIKITSPQIEKLYKQFLGLEKNIPQNGG